MGLEHILAALLLTAAAADKRPEPTPLPAHPPADEFRVVVDQEAPGEREDEAPPPRGRSGVRRHGLGRLVSVDAKERKLVLEHEDGIEETYAVPDGARLTFAGDERPLRVDQLRRGDAVSYEVQGGKVTRLHLDLCGDGSGGADEDVFAPPPRRAARGRRPPPPPEEDEPEPRAVDEPDTPMYQSEPPESPKPPAKPPAKKSP